MTLAHALAEQLEDSMRTRKMTLGITSFAIRLTEREQRTSGGEYSHTLFARITLGWQDGSRSEHLLDALPAELPLEDWKGCRFLSGEETILQPPVRNTSLVCDEQVPALLRSDKPLWPDNGYTWTLGYEQHTCLFSNGHQYREQLTDVQAHSPDWPVSTYASRRWPSPAEQEYVQTELAWFHRSGMERLSDLPFPSTTQLLLAPDAWRTIVWSWLTCRGGYNRGSLRNMRSDQLFLQLVLDPTVPWSRGSAQLLEAPFTRQQPVLNLLDIPHSTLFTHAQKNSLHLRHPSVRRWTRVLHQHPHVCLLSQAQVTPLASLDTPAWIWSPRACLFAHGQPVACGPLRLPFRLRQLLTATPSIAVSRVGWDGYGLALPLAELVPSP